MVMAGWEGAVAVGAFGFVGAVESCWAGVVVCSFAAVVASRLFGALSGVAVTLAAGVVSGDSGLLSYEFRELASVKEPESLDWGVE